MKYFFYGTLCDPDVQSLILGYKPSPRQLQPARLHGYRRKQALGRSYPVLIRAPGGVVDGLLFHAARPQDAARLASYEGPEYRTRHLPVHQVAVHHASVPASPDAAGGQLALVFLPARGALPPARTDWRLSTWQRRQKTDFLRSLHHQGPMPCASR